MTYKNMKRDIYRTLSVGILLVTCAVPYALHADTTTSDPNLAATVRSAILQDPRTASMSSAQLDQLVNALTQKAQDQGMTSHDITYRPLPPEQMPDYTTSDKVNAAVSAATCGNMPGFVCMAERSLGIEGPRTPYFILFGLVAGVLLLVIIGFFWHHHKHGELPA